jgi:hypothetical protein
MGSSGAWKWKRAEPVAPPFVLLVDSLLLLFQIEWHELAGFCAAVKRRYRDRLEWKSKFFYSAWVLPHEWTRFDTISRAAGASLCSSPCIALFPRQ